MTDFEMLIGKTVTVPVGIELLAADHIAFTCDTPVGVAIDRYVSAWAMVQGRMDDGEIVCLTETAAMVCELRD